MPLLQAYPIGVQIGGQSLEGQIPEGAQKQGEDLEGDQVVVQTEC